MECLEKKWVSGMHTDQTARSSIERLRETERTLRSALEKQEVEREKERQQEREESNSDDSNFRKGSPRAQEGSSCLSEYVAILTNA